MTALSSIPTAPKALPLLGHLVQLLRNPLEFLTTLPTHGDLVRIRLGPLNVIVACDPECACRICGGGREPAMTGWAVQQSTAAAIHRTEKEFHSYGYIPDARPHARASRADSVARFHTTVSGNDRDWESTR